MCLHIGRMAVIWLQGSTALLPKAITGTGNKLMTEEIALRAVDFLGQTFGKQRTLEIGFLLVENR